MAKNIRNEVRKAIAAPAQPQKRVAPVKPAALEKRVAPVVDPAKKAAATSPKKPAPAAEKRVVAVTPTAAKPSKRQAVGKSKNVLARYYETILLLDEIGPEITELTERVIRPLFHELEANPSTSLSLAIAEKAISRTITGTGLTELDGERFAIKEGELIMLTEMAGGGVCIYNTNTDEPVAMVLDSKSKKTVQYVIVPTEPAEFDKFIDSYGKRLEALGVPVQWESATPVV